MLLSSLKWVLCSEGTHRFWDTALTVRQSSLCGWGAALSQERQAHWRGKLADFGSLVQGPGPVDGFTRPSATL